MNNVYFLFQSTVNVYSDYKLPCTPPQNTARQPGLKGVYFLSLMFLCFFSMQAFAQNRTVTGKVTAASDNTPLPGVNVLVKGTTNGTTTDPDGVYSLSVPSNDAVLVYSFIGYTTQEVPVGAQSTINVQLADDVQALQEVVVIGYGTQQKKEVTGSIAKVDGSKLTETPTPSFESALQGRAPGVQVIQGSGLAGSGAVIRVRGIGSLSAGGDPLYVVDGIPITQDPFINGDRGAFNTNPLSSLNPNDIESVEILKDASAAGIYGSRGANGVILITTKRGKSGKPTFNFSTRVGISEPSRVLNMLDNREWLQLRQEAYENDGGIGRAPLPGGISWEQALATNTDWIGLTTQTGFKQEYNLSMTQGGKKLKSYVGFSYNNNESYLKNNSFIRLSGRANIDYNILPNLTFSLSTSLSRGQNNRVPAAWSGGLGAALSEALPIYPVRNDDGTYFVGGNNPVRQLELTEWRTIETRTINNAVLSYEPVKNLTLKVSGGLDYMDIADDQYEPQAYTNTTHRGLARRYPAWITNYNTSATATYNWSLNNNNRFTFLLGSEYQKSKTERYDQYELIDATKPFYKDPEIVATNLTVRTAPDQIWTFLSYFSRVNYTLMDKYIFQASARIDGSSRFGRNNRYGFFPTAAVGYIVSEEDFLKDNAVISFLKLKASYGITGNADIPNYQRFGVFSDRNNTTNYNGQPTIYPIRLENPNLAWETLKNLDMGFELGLFDGRINAEFAYYNKLSEDVLVNRLTQPSTGFATYFENIGKIRNRGFEFSFTSRNLVGDFKWSTDFNIGRNTNKVLDIGNTAPDAIGGTGDTRVLPGYPVGVNYLVRFSRVDPESGLPVWLDRDGNETTRWDLNNRVIVGDVVPDFIGGITNNFSYKNFDLSVLFAFTKGGNIYDDAAKRQLGVVTGWNMRPEIADRWRKPGDVAQYPRLTLNPQTYGGLDSEWNYNSTLFLYDGSFVRLRNVTLGYNLPLNFVNRLKLSNARVFLTGVNLLTFTKYPGLDPEIARDFNGPQARNVSPNISYLTPPQERSVTVGLNLSF